MLPQAQRIDAFVDYTASAYGVPAQSVRDGLARAQFLQRTVDIIARPAEAVRPWSAYRPIFLDDTHITGGVAFYAANRADLDRIAATPACRPNTSSRSSAWRPTTAQHRQLPRARCAVFAGFGYPKRAPFFAGELAQLFALGQDEHIDVASLTGSYAGAMGLGQFMPSSYRLWGKDGDGDGKRDLISRQETMCSHRSRTTSSSTAGSVAVAVVARGDTRSVGGGFRCRQLDPVYPLPLLAQRGYRPQAGEPVPAAGAAEGATVITLDGDAGKEYWFGYRNFYVITRYNHSPMYAMAVHQLAQAIRAGSGGA